MYFGQSTAMYYDPCMYHGHNACIKSHKAHVPCTQCGGKNGIPPGRQGCSSGLRPPLVKPKLRWKVYQVWMCQINSLRQAWVELSKQNCIIRPKRRSSENKWLPEPSSPILASSHTSCTVYLSKAMPTQIHIGNTWTLMPTQRSKIGLQQ